MYSTNLLYDAKLYSIMKKTTNNVVYDLVSGNTIISAHSGHREVTAIRISCLRSLMSLTDHGTITYEAIVALSQNHLTVIWGKCFIDYEFHIQFVHRKPSPMMRI